MRGSLVDQVDAKSLVARDEGVSTLLDVDYASTWHGCTESAHTITQCVEKEFDVDINEGVRAFIGVVEYATGRYARLLGRHVEVWRDPKELIVNVTVLD